MNIYTYIYLYVNGRNFPCFIYHIFSSQLIQTIRIHTYTYITLYIVHMHKYTSCQRAVQLAIPATFLFYSSLSFLPCYLLSSELSALSSTLEILQSLLK